MKRLWLPTLPTEPSNTDTSTADAQASHGLLVKALQAEGFTVIQDPMGLESTTQADLVLLSMNLSTYREQLNWCANYKATVIGQMTPVMLYVENSLVNYGASSVVMVSPASIKGAMQVNDTNLSQVMTSVTTMAPEAMDITASLDMLIEGLHVGADDYIKPPVTLMELVSKIQSALRSNDSLDKARELSSQLNQVNDELTQRNLQIEKELYIARQLQQSLLPRAIVKPDETQMDGPMMTCVNYQDERIRVSGIYLPCDALGGDLYDVIQLQDGALGVSITDVSGHGVPAGFITAIFKTALYRSTLQHRYPSDVLYHLNNELYQLVKTGDYVTSVFVYIDAEARNLWCSGAGHPYPYLYQAATGTIVRLEKNGTPLVWVPDMPYPQDEFPLGPGDKLFLFTDGVTELRNTDGDMFGEERLADCLRDAIQTETPYINDHIITTLSDFTQGEPLADDLTMVLIEITA